MIVRHIQRALQKKSSEHIDALRKLNQGIEADEPLSSNIKVLKESNQLNGMHTILHNRETTREDFVFYFDRISTLLIEKAMDHLEHVGNEVETAQGLPYKGYKLATEVGCSIPPHRSCSPREG
jgi:uridine kinase